MKIRTNSVLDGWKAEAVARTDLAQELIAPLQDIAVQKLAQQADAFLGSAERIVWLGMGGASLAPQLFASLAPSAKASFVFADGLDEAGLQEALAGDLQNTRFVVASQSGQTIEVLVQFSYVLQALAEAKQDPARAVLVITAEQPSPIRQLAEHHKIAVVPHPAVGGRYSAASPVGLLAAHWAGFDIATFHKEVLAGLAQQDLAQQGAGHNLSAMAQGKNISVLWLPSPRWRVLGQWFVQLWSESLGKQGKGSMPVCACLPADLHSQWQMFLDGADDKFYTIARLTDFAPPDSQHNGTNYTQVLDAQTAMLWEELSNAKRPVREITSPLGTLLGFWMLETITTAPPLGISPFGQPAVESGKAIVLQNLKGKK